MKFKSLLTLAAAAVLVASPAMVRADAIPYQNIGTPAPANVFTATNTGYISAYFYGSDAGYDSKIGLLVNNLSTGITGLPNHSTSPGQSVVLNTISVQAGDILTFQLYVENLGYSWYSDPILNIDGLNHVYATTFSGISYGGDNTVPPGLYLAFEDLPGLGDVDYNDHQFIVTNVSIGKVPDVSSTFVLGAIAFAGLGFMRRRLKA